MRRIALVFVALAVLAVFGARDAQVSAQTPHRKTTHTAGRYLSSRAHRSAAGHSSHSPGAAKLTGSATSYRSSVGRLHPAASHRPTADEVGRAAGLEIRRQLNQRHSLRRRGTLRRVRLERTYRARTGSEADFDPSEAAPTVGTDVAGVPGRATRTYQAASVESNPESRSAAPVSEFEGQAFAVGSDPVSASTRVPAGMADTGDQPVERMAPSPAADAGVTGHANRTGAASLGSATAATAEEEDTVDRNSPPPTEAASVRTETEEASLIVPHIGMPSPLRGSLESLERQNARLDAEGLERIEDESDLAARIADGLLVPLPASAALTVNSDLLANHRYCRPWTAKFLADLAREHEAVFHKPIEVSSAVRTVEYQRRLMRTNGNAAPAEGDIVSPHLTGASVDIAKSGLSRQEMAWMRQRLLALETAGKIDVEEEFRQACFHITVYKSYAPEHAPRPRRRHAPLVESEATVMPGL